MYQPLEAWLAHDLRHAGLRWMSTSVPGGAMGVGSKENDPSIALNVDRRGF